MLKDAIIGRIKDFFSFGFDEHGDIVSEKYALNVLSKNKSVLYASIQWLCENNVIDCDDFAMFELIKEKRNEVARQLPSLMFSDITNDIDNMFQNMTGLLNKIEVWWVVNVEIPTDPDYCEAEINEEEVVPGTVVTMRLMVDIALGPKDISEYYYKELFGKNP